MIDRIKNIVETILNKEKVGAITPEQFMDSCDKAQKKIYANYFDSEHIKNANREARGLANDVVKLYEQKISNFFETATVTLTSGIGTLPSDMYFIDRNGIIYSDDVIVDILKKSLFRRDKTESSTTFPIGYLKGTTLEISPTTIASVEVDYYKQPLKPKWTYTSVGNVPFFNSGASDFQDFQIHESEEPEIIREILQDFGIIKREIVNEYMDGLLPDDPTYNIPKRFVIKKARNAIKLYKTSTIRDFTVLELDLSSTLQITLPLDYFDYYRISWVDDDGKLFPMARNNRLSIAKGIIQDHEYKFIYDESGNYITAQGTSPSVDSTVEAYSNFNFDRGQYFENGDFNIDKDAGIIKFGSDAQEKTIVLEYISDGVYNKTDANIKIDKVATQTINDYIYFYLIKRQDKISQSEKTRARRDWKVSERKMKAAISPIRLEDVLQVDRSKSRWVKQS